MPAFYTTVKFKIRRQRQDHTVRYVYLFTVL